MQSKIGLTPWSCLGCNCVSYVSVHSILQTTTVKCLHCHISISVSDIEESNKDLKRVLTIMKQLANARDIYHQYQKKALIMEKKVQVAEGIC